MVPFKKAIYLNKESAVDMGALVPALANLFHAPVDRNFHSVLEFIAKSGKTVNTCTLREFEHFAFG